MKKFLMLGLIFTNLMFANEKPQEVRVITYTVTICKQEDTNQELWDKMVNRAEKINRCDQNKRLKKISKTLRNSRQYIDENNFFADVQVKLDDGICRCKNKNACLCYGQYKGVCPCATLINKSCDSTLQSCCEKK